MRFKKRYLLIDGNLDKVILEKYQKIKIFHHDGYVIIKCPLDQVKDLRRDIGKRVLRISGSLKKIKINLGIKRI
ncbi:hypothetical protein HRbin06_01059 [archaeon HR06]|nr:hypothetical protein HRbin06_01059 [archaeon HR06]